MALIAWNKRHGKNILWFEKIAAKGVHVKALAARPELLISESFYLEMYQVCGADFGNIKVFCELYGFGNDEILESIKIVRLISIGAANASNTT